MANGERTKFTVPAGNCRAASRRVGRELGQTGRPTLSSSSPSVTRPSSSSAAPPPLGRRERVGVAGALGEGSPAFRSTLTSRTWGYGGGWGPACRVPSFLGWRSSCQPTKHGASASHSSPTSTHTSPTPMHVTYIHTHVTCIHTHVTCIHTHVTYIHRSHLHPHARHFHTHTHVTYIHIHVT